MQYKIIFYLLLFLFFPLIANAESTDSLFYTFIDSTGQYNCYQVLNKDEFKAESVGNNTIYYGFNEYVLWVKLRCTDLSSYQFIQINNAHLDFITLYKVKNNNIIDSIATGDHLPFSTREFNNNMFVFSIDKTCDYYLFKVQTEGMLSLPFEFLTTAKFIEPAPLLNEFYYGMLLVAVCFVIFLVLRFRQLLYIYYLLNLVALGVVLGTDGGLMFEYLWPNRPIINHFVIVFYSTGIFLLLFVDKFLAIKENAPGIKRIFNILYAVICVNACLNILGLYNFPIKVALIIATIIPFINLFAGLRIFFHNKSLANFFYNIAFVVYCIFYSIYILSFMDLFPTNYIIKNALFFANLIQILFLFLAIVEKFNSIEKERIKSDRLLIAEIKKNESILLNQNKILEERVNERTSEIESLNEELNQTNEELISANESLNRQKTEIEQTLLILQNTQNQLIQSEKMASLGVLVAGIAHEINNPVNFISASWQGIRRYLDEIKQLLDNYLALTPQNYKAEIQKINEKETKLGLQNVFRYFKTADKNIVNGINRVIEITSSLRNYSYQSDGNYAFCDLADSIKGSLVILSNEYKYRIEVIEKYGNVPPVKCISGKINQVFMNILNNAIDSIQGTGTITIRTYYDKASSKVVVSIKDTGQGIPDSVKSKIFDPFFTTKEVGKGTGLGLYIAYGIIQQHNGEILVTSEVGKGTEFIIKLPV